MAEYGRAAEDASADAVSLLELAVREFDAGRIGQGQTALLRLVSTAPDREGAVLDLSRDLRSADPEAAFACVEVLADAALLDGRFEHAADLLQAFLDGGASRPALAKFVEVCIEAGFDDRTREAQAALADAYLAAGRAFDARPHAEAALAREPESEVHAARLRHILVALGVEDVELAVSLARSAPPAASLSIVEAAADDSESRIGRPVEIDLSPQIDDLTGTSAPESGPPRDLDAIFADLRGRAAGAETEDPGAAYAAGLAHLQMGRVADGVRALEVAARSPRYRFESASRIGRIRLGTGDAVDGVEWLERATEAPAPTPDEGLAVLYELADALTALGEDARALTVLAEIDASRAGYRDVADRIRALRARAGDVR